MRELVNNLPEFVFFGSVIGFYVLTVVFIIFLFLSEVTENGYVALVSFIIFSLAARFFGNFEMEQYLTLKMVGIYIAIGFAHSIIRTYFYGRKRGLKRKELLENYPETDYHVTDFNDTTLSSLKGNVFRWWFLFPVSFLTWLLSDLLRDFWNQVYDLTKKSYEYFLKLGMDSIK